MKRIDQQAGAELAQGTGFGAWYDAIGLFGNNLRVSNLLNRKDLLANAGSGSNVTPDASGNPVADAGAPRFSRVTFQVDY